MNIERNFSEYLPATLRRCLASVEEIWSLENRQSLSPKKSCTMDVSIKPFSVTHYAAVLFADIAGFTRLSSSMNAEELKKYINSFFTRLLNIVERFNGDVVKFCGDALLIVWPLDVDAPDKVKAAAVGMATKCAIALIGTTHLETSVNLKLHCGISAGNVHCMHLGDFRRMEFLVSGDPVTEAGIAAGHAGLEKVCWSGRAYFLVIDKFVACQGPDGHFILQECTFYEPNCHECALYASLHYSPPRSVPKSRSSPLTIRQRTSSASADGTLPNSAAHSPPSVEKLSPLGRPRGALERSQPINRALIDNYLNSPEKTDKTLSAVARSPIKVGSKTSDSTTSTGRKISDNSSYLIQSHLSESLNSEKSSTSMSSKSNDSHLSDMDQWMVVRQKSKALLENKGSLHASGDAAMDHLVDETSSLSISSVDLPPIKTGIGSGSGSEHRHRSRSLHETDGRQSGSPAPRYSLNALTAKVFSGAMNSRSNSPVISTPNLSIGNDYTEVETLHRAIHEEEYKHEAEVVAFLAPFQSSSSDKYSSEKTRSTASTMCVDTTYRNSYMLFVPSPAQNWGQGDILELEAEMRIVTTMFIEILGVEDDFKTGNVDKPQKAIRTILRSLNRYGGFLRQYVVDDKGCVAIVGFGVPGYCHDDNSVRAIEAAASIRRHLQNASMDCRIGISVGHVYCGLVGSSYRCEYAMMGSSVNLAARLMSKGKPGQILVDNMCHQDTNALFQFEELPKVIAKGYKLPIAVYSPVSRCSKVASFRITSPHANIFVGRTKELEHFNSILAYISQLDGKSSGKKSSLADVPKLKLCNVIEGPPGIGKSWFLAEIQSMASKFSHLAVCCGIASPPTNFTRMKYDVIGQLVEQLLGISALMNSAATARRLLGETDNLRNPSFSSAEEGDSSSPMSSRAVSVCMSMDATAERMDKSDQRLLAMEHVEDWVHGNFDPTYRLVITRKQLSRTFSLLNSKDSFHSTRTTGSVILEDRNSDSDSDEELSHMKQSALAECGDELSMTIMESLSLLNSVLPVRFIASDSVLGLTSDERTKFREALLVHILARCVEKTPTLIIIKKLNWCDTMSLRVLLQFMKSSYPMFVCTVDHTAGVAGSDILRRAEDVDSFSKIIGMCSVHSLAPFSPEETEALLRAIIGEKFLAAEPRVLSDDNLAVICSRTAGSPLLISALSLKIREAISTSTLSDIKEIAYGRLDQSINKFDLLSKAAQFVLKVASVIGMSFSEIHLYLLLSELKFTKVAVDLTECLKELVRRNFIDAETSGAVSDVPIMSIDPRSRVIYRFRSSSIHENVYSIMLQNQRQTAHGIFGKILETSLPVLPDLLETVVYHFSKSNMHSKKVEYYNRALEHAQEVFSCTDVQKYAEELTKLFTGGTAEELLEMCSSAQSSVAPVGSPSRRPWPFSMLQHSKHGNKRLPTFVRPLTVWLHPDSFASSVVEESDSEYLAGFVALQSIVLFRRGKIRLSHNLALLALHYFGVLKVFDYKDSSVLGGWLRSRTHEESASILSKTPKFSAFRVLTERSMRLISSIAVQLSIISLLYGRCKISKFYFLIAGTVSSLSSKRFPEMCSGSSNDVKFPMDYILPFMDMKHSMVSLFEGGKSSVPEQQKSPLSGSGKTDYESKSSEWDLYSNEDISPPIMPSRSRTTSSQIDQDYFKDSKFIMDATVHMCTGLTEAGNAKFASAYSTFGSAIHSLNIDSDDFGATYRQYLTLENAWVAFLAGNAGRSRFLCASVIEYSRAFKQVGICKWAIELDMLHQLLSIDLLAGSHTSTLEHSILEINNRTLTDTPSPCSCAVLALSLAVDRNPKRSVPLAKFAVSKLSSRVAVTFVPGVFLFVAGYAAALTMQHDNQYWRQLPADVGLNYRSRSPRVFQVCKEIVLLAIHGLSTMALRQPCLTLLADVLNCKLLSVTLPEKLKDINAAIDRMLSETNVMKFNEFVFAKAFLQLERQNVLTETDKSLKDQRVNEHALQRHNEIKQSTEFYFRKLGYPLSNQLAFTGQRLRSSREQGSPDSHSQSRSRSGSSAVVVAPVVSGTTPPASPQLL